MSFPLSASAALLLALTLAGCGSTTVGDAGGTTGGGTGGSATSTTATTSTTTTDTTGTGGEIPGTCPSYDAGPASPGTYDGDEVTYTLFKKESAANLCLIVQLSGNGPPAFGVAPSFGYAVSGVEITNDPSDCGPAMPAGMAVQASCGSGALTAYPCPAPAVGGSQGFDLSAQFTFPPSFPWVPSTDAFDAQGIGDGYWMTCD
jgi:hypothetical protein